MTTARVRGIYTTAITRLLSETGREVVQASEPIRERFERSFDAAPADVSIETTRDRQGIEISGTPDAVEPVANELEDLAIDTFRWPDDVSRGAVFDADVLEAGGGSGAVVDLGDGRRGFLKIRRRRRLRRRRKPISGTGPRARAAVGRRPPLRPSDARGSGRALYAFTGPNRRLGGDPRRASGGTGRYD